MERIRKWNSNDCQGLAGVLVRAWFEAQREETSLFSDNEFCQGTGG